MKPEADGWIDVRCRWDGDGDGGVGVGNRHVERGREHFLRSMHVEVSVLARGRLHVWSVSWQELPSPVAPIYSGMSLPPLTSSAC